ncbi:MAG: hypothetical protein FWD81_00975 [Methanomassiliicoccaceae archaeon]|nr:hypothetical protein [Methanomassiliicoccaceae archaeon]
MPYSIPNDDRLEEAIRAVIGRDTQIRSQSMMTDLVLKELRKESEDYRVSGERIRRVAIERNILRIDIDYNQHDDRTSPDVCPVCGYPMAAVNNTTLSGGAARIGRQCTKCPYQTGSKRRTPGRYTFSKGHISKSGMNTDDRVTLIKDASELMKKAAAMVESATKGTEYGRRGKSCANNIKRTITSKKNANSLTSISKDMRSGSDDPEWTKALTSVKNTKLKDI